MLGLFLSKEEKAKIDAARKIQKLDDKRQSLMRQRDEVNQQMAEVTLELDKLREG